MATFTSQSVLTITTLVNICLLYNCFTYIGRFDVNVLLTSINLECRLGGALKKKMSYFYMTCHRRPDCKMVIKDPTGAAEPVTQETVEPSVRV
jgi:hypothetical protein